MADILTAQCKEDKTTIQNKSVPKVWDFSVMYVQISPDPQTKGIGNAYGNWGSGNQHKNTDPLEAVIAATNCHLSLIRESLVLCKLTCQLARRGKPQSLYSSCMGRLTGREIIMHR